MKRKTWICSLLAAAIAAPAFSLDWVTDFDAAKAQAAKEGKAVLVDFTGSDWCGFCIKLKKEVFDSPEFDAYAKDKFVCLEIDLPQGNKISAEQKKINEELSELYNVDGFPSIFVMTPQGYVVGGFCGFRALPEVQKALDTGLANAKAIADAEKQGNDAKVDAMFKVWKGLGDELAGSAQQLRSDLVKLDVNDRCGLRTQKQAEEEIRDVQKQLQDCVQEAGSKGLKDALALLESKQGSLMEQNRHAAIQIKTSMMFLLCETQEDLNRMRDTLVAELKALDPAKYDAEQIEQDIQRITQIAADGQQALDYAKESRQSMDERAEAAKAAEREAAEEAKLQSEGATKLEWGTDLAAAKEQAAKLDAANKAVVTGDDAELLIQEKLKQIEAEPKNLNARRALARIYIQGKRYYEAIDALQQAIEVSGTMDPELDRMLSQTKVQYYDQQIEALRANGQEEDAVNLEGEKNQFVFDDLAARVERYPNDLHLRFELGKQYFTYGYYDDALTHLQLAQKSPKDRLWALYYLAMCFLSQGQNDMGVMQLETARDAIPTMDDLKKKVVYQLGLCAEAAGDLQKAYQYYKDVYSADVGFEDLSERMLAVSQALKNA